MTHASGRRSNRFAGAALEAAVLLCLAATSVATADDQRPQEPVGYRMEDYRTPTPATLAGARVVDTQAAFGVWRDKAAIFVDVLPQAPKPANLPASTVWRDKRRDNIPGGVWLADVGYGALSPQTEAYFRKGLDKASAGDKRRPLLFYCLADCWMSWNAARRALEFGYINVLWYPEGTDGWSAAGHPLAEQRPEPRD